MGGPRYASPQTEKGSRVAGTKGEEEEDLVESFFTEILRSPEAEKEEEEEEEEEEEDVEREEQAGEDEDEEEEEEEQVGREEQAGEDENERIQGELERAGRVIPIFGDV